MKKITLLCFLLVSTSFFAQSTIPFITTWLTTTASETITIPTNGSGYNYSVDWGDSSTNTTAQTGNTTHTYVNAGTYTVTITGTFPRIYFNNTGAKNKIMTIQQWGDNPWTSMSGAFYGCSNLTSTATDAPNLSNVTDMSFMFRGATAFNQDLSSWDVSSVTDMRFIFLNATAFNGNISTWNVSNVIDMYYMFAYATAFNQDLSTWNVSSVTNMRNMFLHATAFNSNLSSWNVSSVTNMISMFANASAFNGKISTWNVSSVTNMSLMFIAATAFNQDLSSWNVSNVTSMDRMFYNATAFNQDLSSWNVSSVTNMYSMFRNATTFNSDISSWNVSSVTGMNIMFYDATAFNQDLGAWDISSVTNMTNMFTGITLATANYDNTLMGWSTLDTGAGETAIPTNINFSGGNSKYCAVAARNTLTGSAYNWTITDGGKDAACGALGVNDYKLNSLMIYPNPSKDMIYINGDVSKIKQLIIYDMLGKQVISSNKNFKAVNIEALNAGIYFVKLNTDESSKIIKFIKE